MASLDENETIARNSKEAENKKKTRKNESSIERSARQESDALRKRITRADISDEEAVERRENVKKKFKADKEQKPLEKLGCTVPTKDFDESEMPFHIMNYRPPNLWDCRKCLHCNAFLFPSENDSFCCSNGQVKVPLPNPPPVLRKLLIDKNYLNNARGYNNRLALGSFGVKKGEGREFRPGGNAPCVKYHGKFNKHIKKCKQKVIISISFR